MVALLGAVEAGEVTVHEGGEPFGAGGDGLGSKLSIGEQFLRLGVIEQIHGSLPNQTGLPFRIAPPSAAE